MSGRLRQRGIVLVVVLWLVALLSLMAVSQTAAVRTETLIVGNLVESATARAAAYAGLQLAVAELAKPIQAREMSSDGALYQLRFGAAQLLVSITDESGKVDLNAAPGTLFDALLQDVVEDEGRREALVAALLDWRDRDGLRRINGAEEEDYRLAGLAYAPRNGPFQSLEELTLVIGFDAPLYHAIADNLTIYSGSVTVNASVASEEVLQAIDGAAGAEDEVPPMSDEPPDVAVPYRRTTSGGSVYSIYAEAQLQSGVRERLEAVVRLVPSRANAPARYEFLRWREGVASRSEER